MSKLVAAIDSSAATRPVLAVASVLAVVLDVDVEAVHVHDAGGTRTARHEADAFGVPFVEMSGPIARTLHQVTTGDEVVALVAGTRGLPGRPARIGHVTEELVTALEKPVVTVPPDLSPSFGLARVLVPLNGTLDGASAVRDSIRIALEHGLEVTVLHIFDEDSLPMFADQPQHEVPAWAAEFLARWCPDYATSVRLELRVGSPALEIADGLDGLRADLVLLGWSQNLSPGHAAVVRRALRISRAPVVLLPIHEHGASRVPRAPQRHVAEEHPIRRRRTTSPGVDAAVSHSPARRSPPRA